MEQDSKVPTPGTGVCTWDALTFDTGHYKWEPGETVSDGKGNIYLLMDSLGVGGYGHVLKAHNRTTNKIFALKVIKNIHKYHESGLKEISILKTLTALDPKQQYLSTRLVCQFRLEKHICFGLELLGLSMYDYMKLNDNVGFPVHQIRHFMYQLVHGVQFLHRNQVVHTDIKLDNILFVHPHHEYRTTYLTPPGGLYLAPVCTRILLTDFGAAKLGGGLYSGVVTTRTSRSPEVVLGLAWTYPVDVWALGCVLFQLFSGVLLFSVFDDLTHLYLMEKIGGQFPNKMIATEPFKNCFVDGYFNAQHLREEVKEESDLHFTFYSSQMRHNFGDLAYRRMADLFFVMLRTDPDKRILTQDLMKHPFINDLPLEQRFQHGLANLEHRCNGSSGFVASITCDCVECQKYR